MNKKDCAIIKKALRDGGLLDALLALQSEHTFLTEETIRELADYIGESPAQLYDTASFYGMLRFERPCPVEIKVCHGTACHSAGAKKLIKAIEDATGAVMGGVSGDGKYSLSYVECLGQCQNAPSMLINGKLYCPASPDEIPELLKGGDF